jgi:hypothetical protein
VAPDLVSDTYGFVGRRFGILTVLKVTGKTKNHLKLYEVLCDCGVKKVVKAPNLKRGKTKSCGCRQNIKPVRHGHTWAGGFSKTYSAWDNMKSRCYRRKNDPTTKYWRGTEVCARWLNSFDNFLEDMGEKPDGLTLDRKDGTKGYTPGNCRWVSRTVQSRNTAMKSNNTSGHAGVRRSHKKWGAFIGVDGGHISLGTFKTKKAAIAARKAGEKLHWGDER